MEVLQRKPNNFHIQNFILSLRKQKLWLADDKLHPYVHDIEPSLFSLVFDSFLEALKLDTSKRQPCSLVAGNEEAISPHSNVFSPNHICSSRKLCTLIKLDSNLRVSHMRAAGDRSTS